MRMDECVTVSVMSGNEMGTHSRIEYKHSILVDLELLRPAVRAKSS